MKQMIFSDNGIARWVGVRNFAAVGQPDLKVTDSFNRSLWSAALCNTESNHKQVSKGSHVTAVVF